MNIFFLILITCFLSISSKAREIGETEITTEDGIEVYRDENYYLLKIDLVVSVKQLFKILMKNMKKKILFKVKKW